MDPDVILQAIDSIASTIAFGLVVLVSFGLIILAILFSLLAIRGFWRWLAGHTMNHVIVSIERKSFRHR
jgi:hypothetical protein